MTGSGDERSRNPKTPDAIPPGDASEVTPAHGPPPGAESREREEAWKRGELRARERIERGSGTAETFPDPGAIERLAFAALADNVRDYAIFLMDPEGRVVYWGEGARLIKWWTNDQAVGAHFRFLYLDGGSEDGTAEGHLAEAARRGEMTSEGQRVRSDGSTFWAGATLTALRGPDGTLHGFAKVTRDLTASHAAEAFLKGAREAAEASRQLEAANRAKGEFLNTMSHELRTPLQAIIAYTELLHMEIVGPLNPTQREQLERIRASGSHLLGLAQDVMDLARLDNGRFPIRSASNGLGQVIAQAIPMVQPQADERRITLVRAVGGSAAELCYWGDEDRVRQILINLLANAIKFTPRDGRVTLSAGSTLQPPPDAKLGGSGPWVYIRVEDNGAGIPPEQLRRIFAPYEQVEGAGAQEGAGLGLAISQRLARLMGGDLTAASDVGVGSSFFIWLKNSAGLPAESEPAEGAQSPASV